MIRRTTTSLIIGVVAWLVLWAPAASAQTAPAGSTVAAGPVVVQVGEVEAPAGRGVLVRTTDATVAPTLAVLIGLSVVSATLAAITARRRTLQVRAVERTTGVMAGRRARTDFWGLPASPGAPALSMAAPREAPRPRLLVTSGVPAHVPSGVGSSPVETRRPVRAGSARGSGQD